MAWQDDFCTTIVPGVGCIICEYVYARKTKIKEVDYTAYTWRCDLKSHGSIAFMKYGYDETGKFRWKAVELENEFGPVSP